MRVALELAFLCLFSSVIMSITGLNECGESSCGDGPGIRFPFRLRDGLNEQNYCGYPGPGFDLTCSPKNETVLYLPNTPFKQLFVRRIDYRSQIIQVYGQVNNCLPIEKLKTFREYSPPFQSSSNQIFRDYGLFNCSASSFSDLDMAGIQTIPCFNSIGHHYRVYAVEDYVSVFEVPLEACTKLFDISKFMYRMSFSDTDFLLYWLTPNCWRCEEKGMRCRYANNSAANQTECFEPFKPKKDWSRKPVIITGSITGSFVVMLLVLTLFRVYNSDKKERESQLRIEKFLEDYKAFKPSRYSYADIKKITEQFKDNLGEGAYGTVYKGKLSNEIFVAVKILNNSKGNGEDFVNEVGTIGRIHHINIVRLVGFCADGFKRALVYEFLQNDTLEKYIKNRSLSWETMRSISLGIAKGIEYLHQGCDQRIVHFDIKPRNILLDQNFAPKISDFGLAKLCAKDQSIVSMSTARGTMGYIAPEVFSRNFGSVSYKSDVYSFGMLLLEMVGGQRNNNNKDGETENEDVGQIYYPEWIYNLLEDGEDLRIHIGEEKDEDGNDIAKRLAIVGLSCIQWHPGDRPSMKVVIQMLEGGDDLVMPSNPFGSTANKRNMMQELEVIHEE